MTPDELQAFRERMKWNRQRLGQELDISQDRLRRMLEGKVKIPRHIALACTALAMGDRPYGEGREID